MMIHRYFGSIVFTIIAVGILVGGFAAAQYFWGWLHPKAPTDVSNSDTLRNVGLMIGGLVAFVFGLWRTWVAERQANASQLQVQAAEAQVKAAQVQVETARREAETARQSLLSERYQRGTEMLGSDVLTIRMGGIYELQQLSKEYPEECHIKVVSLFCDFLRNPVGSESDPEAVFVEIEGYHDLPKAREDMQAIASAIGYRGEKGRSIELEEDFVLNLREAVLTGTDMQRADFTRADLRGAVLFYANLADATLPGAQLNEAKINGTILSRANCAGAYFNLTQMTHCIAAGTDFSCARMFGANLLRSTLEGAKLANAKMDSTNLFYVNFSNADVSGTLFGTRYMPADADPAILEGEFSHISQQQLDEAIAEPANPPRMHRDEINPRTGKPYLWEGQPMRPPPESKDR